MAHGDVACLECDDRSSDITPCDVLLDPTSSARPNHVCYHVFRRSTAAYVERFVDFDPTSTRNEWQHTWPLPVGRDSMRAWFRGLVKNTVARALTHDELVAGVTPGWTEMFNAQLNPTLRGHSARNPTVPLTDSQRERLARHRIEELPPPPVRQQPSAKAGLIVEHDTPQGWVVLFGLVTKDNELVLNFVEPVVISEASGPTKELAGTADDLRRWYRGLLLDKPVAGGAPPGPRIKLTLREVQESYESLLDVYNRPTIKDVAASLCISKRTLQRFLHEQHKHWPPAWWH